MTMRDKVFRVQGSGERSSFFVLRSLLRGANTPDVATKNQEPRTKNASRHGLTLIELLSSFVILAIIVSLLAMTLNSATDNWRESQARTRVVAQARAMMDAMSQDIRQAVADTNFLITVAADPATYYGATTNTSIQFYRLIARPATNQYAVEEVCYGMAPSNGTFQLCRWSQDVYASGSSSPESLSPSVSHINARTLADGLAALRFAPLSTFTNTPPYIDIYFELLGDDDCRTSTTLSDMDQRKFVERHVLRFSQRVFLPAVNKWNLP